ncbi:type II toxin-antitoxin system RelB/DinJ family antitoxin [Patescibacteria group bacterium]|nr:type II toxin-antitoxin system RelB/DinJ family antitoxin [Patescibacteria group bacterium]MBU1931335.1 type II toxin-antitoxin system RelB/DinJ family antitoxin [Patescibacteria group bacterium]
MKTISLSQAKKTQYLQVRLDPRMKAQAESVLERLGLSMTQAVKLFFRQVIMRKAIPFSIVIPKDKRAYATVEEEAMIEASLKQISEGKSVTVDMENTKQVAKYFGA